MMGCPRNTSESEPDVPSEDALRTEVLSTPGMKRSSPQRLFHASTAISGSHRFPPSDMKKP